jgi:phage replication O-like protein O
MTQITPPNYTQIPNVVFDHWMGILSPSAFKILMCFCRKTFGWHKTVDTISKNQIVKVTGLSKNTIQSSIEELEAHGLLSKVQSKTEYGFQPNSYLLNVFKPVDQLYQDPKDVQNLGGGGSESDLGVGQGLTEGVGQGLTPQKKDNTKEILTKEREGASTPAPASSSKKIQREEHISTTDEEHQRLAENLGVEMRDKCYKKLSDWKLDTPKAKWKKDDNRSILRWVVDAIKEETLKKKASVDLNLPEENKTFAKMIEDNYGAVRARARGVRIEALNAHLEFIPSGATVQPIVIKYNEHGFRDKVDSAIKKLGL